MRLHKAAGLVAGLTAEDEDPPQPGAAVVDLIDHLQHEEGHRVERAAHSRNQIDRQAVGDHDADNSVEEQTDTPDGARRAPSLAKLG